MLRFVADENFDGDVLRGILRAMPNVDIVRAQDLPIMGKDDRTLLEWAARENRILLTHDIKTMSAFAAERIEANKPMPGVILVKANASVGRVIAELVLVIELGKAEDFGYQILRIPM